MGTVLVDLLPLIVGAAVLPVWIIMAAPIIVYAVAPTQSARLLDAAQGWLERHNRTIVIAVSLVFGLWFSWKGITGLLG